MSPRKEPFKNGRTLIVNLTIGGKIKQKEYHCEKDVPIDIPLYLLAFKLGASSLSAYENGKIVGIMDLAPSRPTTSTPYIGKSLK
ncbi:hypothetical protein [Paenibacillus glucanolyticus]|uniref:hypothetical protein n=1 Tax=Paenibacillus glucanolyticus TaxID=59843 RepID=UPI00096E6352|nr:hypothetical protein [Paenibacillus glucanolyticus]OMF76732.1 hypothetical protein BK142_14525 [Paenibacillus glucanolyticus]